ncbi:hypothetical protein V2W45_1464171 [Cenococcum geophilum]
MGLGLPLFRYILAARLLNRLALNKDNIIQYLPGLGGRDVVSIGIIALVIRLNAVIKFSKPSEWRLMDREKLVYQRLGYNYCGILRYFRPCGAIENAIILYWLNAKLSDFARLAINDLLPLICYKTNILKKTKLFALSLTIYKIITGSKLYNRLLDKQICIAFIEGRFLDLEPLLAFRDSYGSVDEVL